MVVVYDDKQKRMTMFQSSDDFNFQAVHQAKRTAKLPENISKYEKFTNNDYERICS